MSDYYVYIYFREEDTEHGPKGSPYYVGKGRAGRAFNRHRVRLPLDRSYVVFVRRGLTNGDAMILEKHLIAEFGRLNKGTGVLANLTDGGEGNSGWVCREETRRKISRAHSGRVTPDHLKKARSEKMIKDNPFRGKTHSEETRKRWSIARKGINTSPKSQAHKDAISSATRGRIPWNKGKTGVQDYSRLLQNGGKFVADPNTKRVRRSQVK